MKFKVCDRPALSLIRRNGYWKDLVAALVALPNDKAIELNFSETPLNFYENSTPGENWARVTQSLRKAMIEAKLWQQGKRCEHSWNDDRKGVFIWLRDGQ